MSAVVARPKQHRLGVLADAAAFLKPFDLACSCGATCRGVASNRIAARLVVGFMTRHAAHRPARSEV